MPLLFTGHAGDAALAQRRLRKYYHFAAAGGKGEVFLTLCAFVRLSCLLHDFSREVFMQRLRYQRLKSLATLKECVHV